MAKANLDLANSRETERQKAQDAKDATEFKQLLDNIENNIIPAKDACPDVEMLNRIKAMWENPRTEATLQTRIDGLSKRVKAKGCEL